MNLRRLVSIIVKELRQLRRDKELLGLFVMAPLLQLFFFGFAVRADLQGVVVGVVMEDTSREARELVQAIGQTDALEIGPRSTSPSDIRRWLESGRAQVAIHIPPGFSRALAKGQSPVVQVLSDGSDANTATLSYQYLSGAAMLWASRARIDHIRRHPESAIRFAGVPQVELVSRFWYNPGLKSIYYMIPGVLTVILLVIAMAHTALMVVKERELGTLEQINVTPIQAVELLVGKTVPAAVLGLGSGMVITLIAVLVFRVPLKGDLLFLALCASLYLLNAMGIGLLVSVRARSQLMAQLICNILISPLLVLSGFLFPIENMPDWGQPLTYVVPTRYYMEVVRGVFLKEQGFLELWPQAAALAGLGTLFYLGGILSYRKQVD